MLPTIPENTTEQTVTVRVDVPREVAEQLRTEMDTEEIPRRNHAIGRNGPFAELLIRRAILPWAKEELGYSQSAIVTPEGDFAENDG